MDDPHMRVKILDIDYVRRTITCSQVNEAGHAVGTRKKLREETRERVTSFHVVGDVVDIWVDRPDRLDRAWEMGNVAIKRMTYPRVRMDEIAARIVEAMAREEGNNDNRDAIIESFIVETGPISTQSFKNGPYSRQYDGRDHTIWIRGEKGLVTGEFSVMGGGVMMDFLGGILTIGDWTLPESALDGVVGRQVEEIVSHPWLTGTITKVEIFESTVTNRNRVQMWIKVPEHQVANEEAEELRQAA